MTLRISLSRIVDTRSNSSRRRRLTSWVAAWLLLTAPAFAVAPLVNVTLEPRQIAVGESAQLTITSTGDGMDGVTLPQVAGLQFRVVGQSRRLEIINGATLSTTSVVLRVTAEAPGIFTIPGITPHSQPLLLRVNPDNGGGSSPPTNGFNSNRPPVVVGGGAPSGIHMTADGSAFVRMNLPKRDVYVGESIPVDIEVGMRAGFVTSLNGLPTLTGNDFTLNNLSRKPERVEKLIDGRPFTVLTWHSVLAPVKPGAFTLSVQSPLTVRIRTRSPKDSLLDDMLGDPFLQNYFGATVPKDITVASPPEELKVLALPTKGQPADFSGAVGAFKIASDMSLTTAAVGEPLTLRLHVTGAGNFDRVDTPMLEHVERWKTYPPKSTFTAGDAIGYKGEKTFEQPLIASQSGGQTLPDLTFSYFDPNARQYETVHATPPKVTIAASLADSSLNAPESATAAANTAAPNAPGSAAPGSAASNGLKADHPTVTSFVSSLVPLYLRPRFLLIPSALALLVAGAWLGRRRTHHKTTPTVRQRNLSKAASRLLQQMEAAARSGDSASFFNAARSALRQTLAARWKVTPDELHADAVDARLGSEGAELRQIFALADEANYAGHRMTRIDFQHWLQIVRHQLVDEQS